MRRFAIVTVIALVVLVAYEGEVDQEKNPTQTLADTYSPETPKEILTPTQAPPKDKPTENVATSGPEVSTCIGIDQHYLMAFHACDSFNVDCHDHRNHQVYLAGADDVKTWSLIPGWMPFQGSVPDVIRRGDTLYVYTGPWLVRYHFDTGLLDEPVQVEVTHGEGWIQVSPSCLRMFL